MPIPRFCSNLHVSAAVLAAQVAVVSGGGGRVGALCGRNLRCVAGQQRRTRPGPPPYQHRVRLHRLVQNTQGDATQRCSAGGKHLIERDQDGAHSCVSSRIASSVLGHNTSRTALTAVAASSTEQRSVVGHLPSPYNLPKSPQTTLLLVKTLGEPSSKYCTGGAHPRPPAARSALRAAL